MRAWSRVVTVLLLLIATACARVEYRPEQRMTYEDRVRLGTIYMQSGQMERAREVLQGAVAREPDRKEARVLLGEALYNLGSLPAAQEQLETALDRGGDDPVVLNNLAWIRIQMGRSEQALEAIERAVEMSPDPLYPYLDTQARVLAKLGRHREALETARAALSLTPEYDSKAIKALEKLVKELEDGR